jgi:alkylation response protein AidB-like acyl-CoA dehydrogenase
VDIGIEDSTLPADVEAHPLVREIVAMRPFLREMRAENDAIQRIPDPLLARLRDAGFYRMVLPRRFGGLQLDPITFTRVIERACQGLGSVGWNLAINAASHLLMLTLPDEGVEELFGDGQAAIGAGTVGGGGTAVAVDGGYRVSGRWSFGSGGCEASWFIASFQIMDNGTPRRSPDGGTLWRGVFPKQDTETIPDTWNVAGLRGTGSFDWRVDDVFVPERRTVPALGTPAINQWSRWPGVTYALPIQAWIGPHHAATMCGVARAGIDALIELAGAKVPRGRPGGALLAENPQVQDAIAQADVTLDAARSHLIACLTDLWNTVAAGRETTRTQRARCLLSAVYAGDSARRAMDLVYRHGGSTSFRADSRIAECWRDLQTIGQTITVAPEWYPITGRALLGLDPGPRLP